MWLNISQSRRCLYAAAYYYYWRFGSTDQHFFKKDKIHFFFQLRDFEHWAPRTEVPRSLKSWWNQPNRKFGWHDLVYFFFWHISSCVKKAETGIYLHNAWQVQFSIISSHTHFRKVKLITPAAHMRKLSQLFWTVHSLHSAVQISLLPPITGIRFGLTE